MQHSTAKTNATRNIVGKRVSVARALFTPSLTQDQLSGKLANEGVVLDRVAISKIECGMRCAFDFEVRALAAVLKVDARWLLGIEEQSGLEGSLPLKAGRSRR